MCLGCVGGGGDGGGQLVQLGVFHSLTPTKLAQLQLGGGHHGVEAWLVQLAGAQLAQLWLDVGVQGRGGGHHRQLVQL